MDFSLTGVSSYATILGLFLAIGVLISPRMKYGGKDFHTNRVIHYIIYHMLIPSLGSKFPIIGYTKFDDYSKHVGNLTKKTKGFILWSMSGSPLNRKYPESKTDKKRKISDRLRKYHKYSTKEDIAFSKAKSKIKVRLIIFNSDNEKEEIKEYLRIRDLLVGGKFNEEELKTKDKEKLNILRAFEHYCEKNKGKLLFTTKDKLIKEVSYYGDKDSFNFDFGYLFPEKKISIDDANIDFLKGFCFESGFKAESNSGSGSYIAFYKSMDIDKDRLITINYENESLIDVGSLIDRIRLEFKYRQEASEKIFDGKKELSNGNYHSHTFVTTDRLRELLS